LGKEDHILNSQLGKSRCLSCISAAYYDN